MKKYLSLLILFVLTITTINAQYKTVNYQYDRNWFNENNPIPSETYWMLNGSIPVGINRVELDVYSQEITPKATPIYSNQWRKGFSKESARFSIPVNMKLRANDNYSYQLRYYRSATQEEQNELNQRMQETILNYLKINIKAKGRKIVLQNSPSVIYNELNSIVIDGLKYYRLDNGLTFNKFSSIVLDKLKQLKRTDLKNAKYNLKIDDEITKEELRYAYFQQLFTDLYDVCSVEVEQLLNAKVLTMVETKNVLDYPTENKQGAIQLNVGYGAIYQSGTSKDLSYGTAPYVGLSIPFGNIAMHNNFISRSSISLGVFLNKVNFSGIEEPIGGPVINIPAYIAYGYKPLSFLRLNFGVTALQEQAKGTFDFKNVYVRPFIGIALELNVSAKFNK